MSWWDFVSDFVICINEIMQIQLFSTYTDTGLFIDITLGGLLFGVFALGTILFYLVPRR